MSFCPKYSHRPIYPYASPPPTPFHAPAYCQERDFARPSGWFRHGPYRSPPRPCFQLHGPRIPRSPVNFGSTPGYYQNGCWFNARLQRRPWAGWMGQPHHAPLQQQQQRQLQLQPEHVPQYHMAAQPGQQQQHMNSSCSLQQPQQQQLTSSCSLQQSAMPPSILYQQRQQQQQILTQSYQSQQQQILPQSYQSQVVMPPACPTHHRLQQQQILPQSYHSQQQQILTQSYQSQVVMPPACPTHQPQQHQQQQQQQVFLMPMYPSQRQHHDVMLQPQQQQILPQSYQSQQIISPSCSSHQLQIISPSCSSQQLQIPLPSQPAQQDLRASRVPRAPQVVAAPNAVPMQVPLPVPAPQQEVEATQVPQVVEAETPPEVVEINLGAGVQATRTHNKLTIDIELSHGNSAVPERRRCADEVLSELTQLIRGCFYRNPLPRRRRNRFWLRHTVPRARPLCDGVLCVLEDKDTQTEEVVESQLEIHESLDESTSSARTLVPEEFLSPRPISFSTPTLLQEEFVTSPQPISFSPSTLLQEESVSSPQPISFSPSTLLQEEFVSSSPILLQEEPCIEQPVAVPILLQEELCIEQPDPICDQTSEDITVSKQPDNDLLKPTGLDTIKIAKKATLAKISPRREPKAVGTAPLPGPEPKGINDETSSWPPLGTRPPTRPSLVKKSISVNANVFKPSQRYNENRFSKTTFGNQTNVGDTESTFQPKQILRNMERYGKELAKSSGGQAEAGAQKDPLANLSGSLQALQVSQHKLDKKHSIQSSKQQQPGSKLIAGNMFALLEDSVAEASPPETKDETAGEEKDHVDAKKSAAKKAKQQKRKQKKKEKARAMKLEAEEKRVNSLAPNGPTSSGPNADLEGKPCEIKYFGNLQVTGQPATTVYEQESALKFLLFRNSGKYGAKETSNAILPAGRGDPTKSAEIPVESQDEFPSLGSRKGRRRSQFLDAVADLTVSKKPTEVKQPPIRRNLWERRNYPQN
ncbi:integrator complex subunit 3 homolog isoform X2 [Drosophila serrata]|uniref:integrator complex subunit 3 homolog isoform X2 n=1 Tax=Drosophila serrata TaxID=7274 RepID=UPI000A1D059F|nr:integrator complex subunit 3 homolog isoform X2 [Drosophila serrata]